MPPPRICPPGRQVPEPKNQNTMLSVLLKIIPLDISSTLSPGLLTVALFLLGNKAHPKTRALAFLIGSALVGICASLLGLSLGQTASDYFGPTKASSIIDLIVGIIFLGFAVGILFVKEKKLKIKPSYRKNDHIISRWFLVGFVMTVINFDAVFLTSRPPAKSDPPSLSSTQRRD